jgi:hypothetical protein
MKHKKGNNLYWVKLKFQQLQNTIKFQQNASKLQPISQLHLQELQKFIKVPKTTFKFIKAPIVKASQFTTPTKCMKAQRKQSTWFPPTTRRYI